MNLERYMKRTFFDELLSACSQMLWQGFRKGREGIYRKLRGRVGREMCSGAAVFFDFSTDIFCNENIAIARGVQYETI